MNCSLATYRSLGPKGGVRMAETPVPAVPQVPSQCTVHSGSSNFTVVSKADGVQSVESANTFDFMADLCSKSTTYSLSSAAYLPIRLTKKSFKRLSRQDSDAMGLKVVLQLPRCHNDSVCYFLELCIVQLGS